METPPPREAAHGLDRSSFPMRLWKKSKAFGAWNPDDVDFTKDRQDWTRLPAVRKECLLQLCALFIAGETAVTLDLVPMLHIVASEGRLDEEMYLTSFLWEEAKHVDLFHRFLTEVATDAGDLSRYRHAGFDVLIGDELRTSMRRLYNDHSPEAQVRAAVIYHIVVEGVMAETGYYLFQRMLADEGSLPGMRRAVGLLRRDESRHIAFGVYLISRLIAEHGDRAYGAFLRRMSELKPVVEESTRQFVKLSERGGDTPADVEELFRYSRERFSGRLQRIVKARTQSPGDLHMIECVDPEEQPR